MTEQPPNTPERLPLLVVDDEPIVLLAVRDLLRQQGYEVTAVADVTEALSCLERHHYAIVMADQQMPRLTGLEFLAEVRRQQPEVRRLLLTAELEPELVRDAINRAEVCRLILKPWQREELLRLVKEAAQHYLARQAERQQLLEAQSANASLRARIQELERRAGVES